MPLAINGLRRMFIGTLYSPYDNTGRGHHRAKYPMKPVQNQFIAERPPAGNPIDFQSTVIHDGLLVTRT